MAAGLNDFADEVAAVRRKHWGLLAEADRKIAYIDAEGMLLRQRRMNAVRSRASVADAVVWFECFALDDELVALGRSRTGGEATTDG